MDAKNTVLTIYRADTAQAQQAVKQLRGLEQTEARKVLDGLNAHNAKLQDQIATFAKVGVAIGGLVALYKGAQIAAKAYLEDVRLESAAAGANVDRLKEATRGLVEEDALLAFAGKTMHGVWKLNQQEMETVLRGATALRKTMGVELQPTVEALTEAITKGSTRALKEFGIEAKDKQDAIRQLDNLYKSLGGNVAIAGDEFEKSQVALADSIDALKGSFGALVISLSPVISGLSAAVDLINDAIAGWKMLFGGDSPWEIETRRKVAEINKTSDDQVNEMLGGLLVREMGVRAEMWARDNPEDAQFALKLLAAMGKKPKAMGASGGGFNLNFAEAEGFSGFGTLSEKMAADQAAKGRTAEEIQRGAMGSLEDQEAISAVFAQQAKFQAAAQKTQEAIDKLELEQKRSLLQQLFGTPSEISMTVEAIKLATTAFEGLTGAAAAGFDAWITGSESFGTAFKKAIAEAMRALAGQMFVESLKHAAFAVGSLAFGDFRGAAQHGQAAAMFGVGALAAGVAAREMGQATGQWNKGAGGAAAGGGGAARNVGARSSGGNQSAAPIIIYVGAEWAQMSSIDQAASVTRMLRLGRRGSPHIRRH